LLFLLPAAIALSAFAPWAITPLLMLGGAYLCFEGAEKVMELIMGHGPRGDDSVEAGDAATLEKQKVSGAIRTDLILSAEIMAIALADVSDRPLLIQAVVLAVVGLLVTVGVYGVVALIVKMDDIGLHLAARDNRPAVLIGRGLVKAMPWLLSALAGIGTAAMIWVGGGILVHGLDHFELSAIPDLLHHTAGAAASAAPAGQSVILWVVTAVGSGICGLAVGSVIVVLAHAAKRHRA
jgi:predicted DNA repair protein MutK